MVSKLEQKIRELDNPNETITKNAENISKELGVRTNTVINYLSAKRRGFKSSLAYKEYIYQRIGFIDNHEYSRYLYSRSRGYSNNLEEFKLKNREEKHIDYLDPRELDKLKSDKPISEIESQQKEESNQEIKSLLESLISKLGQIEQRVIEFRFYRGETLEEIGDWLGLKAKNKRQRAKHIEAQALVNLYRLAKQSGLYDLYVEKL